MAEDTNPETTLKIRRTFAAPREKVFRAWTEPEELKKWFGPSDEYSTPIAEVDLRVGGRYRIGMRSPGGDLHVAIGTYREVRSPEKLVYTWSWEGGQMGETLVTVEFHALGGSTEAVLTHEFFPSMEEREKHESGWNGCLSRLPKAL